MQETKNSEEEETDVVEKLAVELMEGGDMTSHRRVQFYESKLRSFILVSSAIAHANQVSSAQALRSNAFRRKGPLRILI